MYADLCSFLFKTKLNNFFPSLIEDAPTLELIPSLKKEQRSRTCSACVFCIGSKGRSTASFRQPWFTWQVVGQPGLKSLTFYQNKNQKQVKMKEEIETHSF